MAIGFPQCKTYAYFNAKHMPIVKLVYSQKIIYCHFIVLSHMWQPYKPTHKWMARSKLKFKTLNNNLFKKNHQVGTYLAFPTAEWGTKAPNFVMQLSQKVLNYVITDITRDDKTR